MCSDSLPVGGMVRPAKENQVFSAVGGAARPNTNPSSATRSVPDG